MCGALCLSVSVSVCGALSLCVCHSLSRPPPPLSAAASILQSATPSAQHPAPLRGAGHGITTVILLPLLSPPPPRAIQGEEGEPWESWRDCCSSHQHRHQQLPGWPWTSVCRSAGSEGLAVPSAGSRHPLARCSSSDAAHSAHLQVAGAVSSIDSVNALGSSEPCCGIVAAARAGVSRRG